MILGIGVDIVAVKRMIHWLEQPELCKKYFDTRELGIVYSRGKSAPQALATRFAAKEAFIKALGTDLTGIKLTEIMVVNDVNGQPKLLLEGRAEKIIGDKGVTRVHISLAHEKDFAVAQIILED